MCFLVKKESITTTKAWNATVGHFAQRTPASADTADRAPSQAWLVGPPEGHAWVPHVSVRPGGSASCSAYPLSTEAGIARYLENPQLFAQ